MDLLSQLIIQAYHSAVPELTLKLSFNSQKTYLYLYIYLYIYIYIYIHAYLPFKGAPSMSLQTAKM